MAYRVATETVGGHTVYRLFDDATGASAAVLPSHGFNLFDLRLPAAGKVYPMLHAAADFAANPAQRGPNGTPVLFPFPNRIRGGAFSFGGKSFQVPLRAGTPNAIHGFAIAAPWDVVEHAVTSAGATVTGQFQLSKNAPESLAHWPADAILRIRYTLAGRRLTLDATVTNPSATELPYGFGTHPYFRLPFPEGGDLARTRVIVPASAFWVLQDLLPTGERKPVDARLDFRQGQPMTGLKLDDVLTGLPTGTGPHVCRLVDEALGAEFRLGFDGSFREVVLYTPPNLPQVIAVEPYTHTTDAINLQARGVDAGLRVLPHDQQATHRITMETTE